MSTSVTEYVEFPMFKGLQQPLEFMGLQGRYIVWAAATAGGAFIGFVIGFLILSFYFGLGIFFAVGLYGAYMIVSRSRKGLNTKKIYKGVYNYTYSRRL